MQSNSAAAVIRKAQELDAPEDPDRASGLSFNNWNSGAVVALWGLDRPSSRAAQSRDAPDCTGPDRPGCNHQNLWKRSGCSKLRKQPVVLIGLCSNYPFDDHLSRLGAAVAVRR